MASRNLIDISTYARSRLSMKTMFKRSGNELRPMRSMCSMASTLYRVLTTALMGGTASFEPVDVLAIDAAVMVWVSSRGARNGQNFETNHAYYYRFDERGRFVEGHTAPADQHLANEFWS